MKKYAILTTATLSVAAFAATNSSRFHLSNIDMLKSEKAITVNMTVNPRDYKLKSTDIVTLTPAIVANGDTMRLSSVSVAGKQAWFYEMRNRTEASRGLLRAGKDDPMSYSSTVPYEKWMERSSLVMLADTLSECRCNEPRRGAVPFANCNWAPRAFQPDFIYETPSDTVQKIFNLSGRANVIFKVNRTNIDWSYASNHAELDTIVRTVNVVRDNPDATVESILLTGYASPEGPYDNNVRLAKGRTEAVKEYVRSQASFPASVYHTNSVPEDWEGLRAWLEKSALPNRAEMIAFIDNPSIPLPQKNDIFRQRFPQDYEYLLTTVYPSLRHTDYKITYKVRKYYDINEIRRVMKTNPRNLSANELFLLANSCEPGSAEYNEAFELAAVLYPNDPTVNLNAANIAMHKGSYEQAERYLDRAGESPLADYGRGVLYALQAKYDQAKPWLQKAKAAGVKGAAEALSQIKQLEEFKNHIEIL